MDYREGGSERKSYQRESRIKAMFYESESKDKRWRDWSKSRIKAHKLK